MWFDDNWGYRKPITVTESNTETSKYATLSSYDASDTNKYQSDCGDIRFTDINGNLLDYTIASCGASTTFHINMPSIPAPTAIVYLYYGNSSAPDGFITTDPYSACSTCSAAAGSETKTSTPTAYWKFDEGYGTTAQDATTNDNDGVLGGGGGTTGGPTKIDDAGDPGELIDNARQVVRNSSGAIYAAFNDGGACEVWKSSDGSSWSQVDSGDTPACATTRNVTLAIDSTNTLHMVYTNSASATVLNYVTISSADQFGTPETVFTAATSNQRADIAIDSNNIPHVAWHTVDGAQVAKYANRVGGSWGAVTIESGSVTSYESITINEDNVPEISYINTTDSDLTVAVGNVNDASSFTLQDVDATVNITAETRSSSIGVDSSGNTWVSYVDATNNDITLIKHDDADAWGTWDNAETNSGNDGKEPSLAIDGTDVYVFYEGVTNPNDAVYNKYTGSWAGEAVLQAGTTIIGVHAKWSFLNNNSGSTQLDYLYSDATDVYWATLGIGTPAGTPAIQTEDQCVTGKCLKFDGSDDAVLVTNASPIDLDAQLVGGFTIQAWIKVNSDGESSVGQVFYKGTNTYLRITNDGADGLSDLEAKLDLGTTDATLTISNGITLNKWHHITLLYTDDGDDEITIYIDGVSKGSSTDGVGAPATDTNDLLIGGTTTANYHGFIDDFKIYNQERSTAQIIVDFNARNNNEGTGARFGADPNNAYKALNDGLVGYWKMDESSWADACSSYNEVTDYSGNGNTGRACPVTTGPTTPLAGKFGNAGDFDGSNDFVEVAETAVLEPNDLTISAWVNFDALPSTRAETATIAVKVNTADPFFSYQFYVSSSDQLCFQWVNNTPDPAFSECNSVTLVTGTWYHMVGVKNGSNLSTYMNGALVGTPTTNLTGTTYNSGNTFRMGAYSASGSRLDGKLDEVRVYNRGLSNNEISQLYNFAPGSVGYWKMEEKTGTTAYDSSGNSNNLDWANTPTVTSGKYGTAISLAGSNQHLTKTDDVDFDFTGTIGITLEAWIKHGTASATETIISKLESSGTDGGYKLKMESDGDLTCETDDDDADTTIDDTVSSTAATYDDGLWHHIACIKDGSSNLYLYIDGVLIATDSSVSSATLVNDDALFVGIESATGTEDWIGQIDEAKIYNYAKTSAQVIANMNANHPAPGSPVGSALGYWKFDEGYGTGAAGAHNSGSQGSALDGTLTGFTSPASATSGWTQSGKFGKALLFDGTGDYVAMSSDVTALKITGDLTLSAWINLTSIAAQRDIICKYTGTASTSAYCLHVNTSGNLVMQVVNSSGPTVVTTTGVKAMSTGTWYHVAGVFKSADSVKLYINGALDKTNTTSIPTTLQNPTTILDIGAENAGSNAMNGTIDEAKVFGQALTADQILVDANRGASQVLGALSDKSTYEKQAANQEYCIPGGSDSCAAPVGRWDFEEGSGSTGYDSSGNGINHSLTSTTYSLGKIGKGLTYNGTSSKSTTASLGTITAFTVEFWIKHLGTTGGVEVIMEDNLVNSAPSFESSGAGSSTFNFWINNTDSVSTTLPIDEWHHVALVYSDSANIMGIYKDGIGSTSATTQTDTLNNALNWGSRAGSSLWANILLDNVRVFNYVRTPAQIAWDYNRGKPIGHWKMDECQGTVINDAAGNTLTGTLTLGASGTTVAGTCVTSDAWFNGVSGKRNYSMDFDGTDDYINVADDAKLDFTASADFSISGWFNRDTFTTDDVIVAKRDGLANTDDGYIVYIDDSTDKLTFEVSEVGDTPEYQLESSSTFTATGWNHFVIVWDDDSAANTEIYINGNANNATDTGTIGNLDDLSNSRPLRIGINSNATPADPYDGKIDDVKIFNYALTPTQAKTLYNDGATRFGPVTGAP